MGIIQPKACLQASGLPWKAPSKFGLNLKDLGTNIDNLAEDFKVFLDLLLTHFSEAVMFRGN